MATLICGSLAYDHLMVFEGRFHEHLLPEQMHILNICFLVPTMQREFGGCAGNIGYSLNALESDAYIMATLGEIDANPYIERLATLGLTTNYVRVLPKMHSAQAMIITDLDNNQITAFHPGAMAQSHLNHIEDINDVQQKITLGMIAPDGIEGMRQHAEQFAAKGIPFIFDPGQQLPLFNEAELQHMLEQATYLAVNDYEAKLLSQKTRWSVKQIASRLNAMVITQGQRGALIYHRDSIEEIPAVPVRQIINPTGCGDAFRGGLIYGIECGLDWSTIGRLANLMGALNIGYSGPQHYPETKETIAARFKQIFNYSL